MTGIGRPVRRFIEPIAIALPTGRQSTGRIGIAVPIGGQTWTI